MAIYHCQVKPISRSTGRSSVAAAAYRSGTSLHNEKEGQTYDFSRRSGVVHSEIIVPRGSGADWALDRQALWNAVEATEKRKDSRVAREFEIALPHELDEDQRLELTRAFSRELCERFGAAVDFSIHKPDPRGSEKNHHAHILMTTRQISDAGLGEKTTIEWENKKLLRQNMPTTQLQMKEVRLAWELVANEALERAGFDVQIDHRSNKARGLELEPTRHVGVHATAVERKGIVISRGRMDAETARSNAEVIREKPEQIIEVLSGEKSVFTKEDIARALHRYIHDDNEAFQGALARIMTAPELVPLRGDKADGIERFTTLEMFTIETDMIASADRLAADRSHGVHPGKVATAMWAQDEKIRASVSKATAAKVARGEMTEGERAKAIADAGLSAEQRRAIEHVTADNRLALVVGVAGAGKSTMLEAAREAWEAQGYRVHGAALSGKATFGLRESSGIKSRTLASWQRRWAIEKNQIGKGDVFVIDEAGMVGSRQLARFVKEVAERGAKIVLVGDHEQLQSIGAGAAFRAIGERAGFVELTEVRRQREGWQAEATLKFSKQQTAEALRAYKDRGGVVIEDTREAARGALLSDYLADRAQRPDGSRVILAHQNADVTALNAEIRATLQERGELAHGAEAGELVFQTDKGKRTFAAGDRIVFLENNDSLGVMNGTLGTVEAVKRGRIVAKLDNGRRIEVPTAQYTAFDHGYATTIHKSQGDTVDRAFVLATTSMDRHMTYVAMTRHRDMAKLYAAREDFERGGGRLVAHGKAPFENNPENRDSYFVTLADDRGQRRTVWGVDLERAMQEAAPEIGDRIALDQTGRREVTLPDGTKAHRNAWEVIDPDELAYKQLEKQLGRDGSKEITLDYTPISREEWQQEQAASENREDPASFDRQAAYLAERARILEEFESKSVQQENERGTTVGREALNRQKGAGSMGDREAENIYRANEDAHREKEEATQKDATERNLSATQEAISKSEGASKSAAGAAEGAYRAEVSAGEARHGEKVNAVERAHQQPTDRKAAYLAERAQMQREMPPVLNAREGKADKPDREMPAVLNRKEAVAQQKQEAERGQENQNSDKGKENTPQNRPAPSRDWGPER